LDNLISPVDSAQGFYDNTTDKDLEIKLKSSKYPISPQDL